MCSQEMPRGGIVIAIASPYFSFMPRGITLESFNVNGLRAVEKKGFLDWVKESSPDILCLQETKAEESQLSGSIRKPDGYKSYFNSGERKGYSGVAIYTKISPDEVTTNFPGILNDEGRVISAAFPWFTVLNVYFPNGKMGEDRLKYKMDFYAAFREYVAGLRQSGREVLVCGDVNTAHKEVDLANPKENAKISGFLPEERRWISDFLNDGFLDTFRVFNREPGQYSWWDVITRARERNSGWRIDYWLASEGLRRNLRDAYIKPEVAMSDHSPVGLIIDI